MTDPLVRPLPATFRIWVLGLGAIELRSVKDLFAAAGAALVAAAISIALPINDGRHPHQRPTANDSCAKDTKDLSNGDLLVDRRGGERTAIKAGEALTAEKPSCKTK